MNELVANFIRDRQIDSFQKLRFLLFLYQNPDLTGTPQQFAEHLYLGNISLLDEIINDLRATGLVNQVENYCKLNDEPDVRLYLQHLDQAFDNPLARQKLLEQVRNNSF